jgi:hypothetical protein
VDVSCELQHPRTPMGRMEVAPYDYFCVVDHCPGRVAARAISESLSNVSWDDYKALLKADGRLHLYRPRARVGS